MDTRMFKLGFLALISAAAFGCVGAEPLEEEGGAGLEELAATTEQAEEALSAVDPDRGSVYIKSITTGGTGCPDEDDVSAVLSGDRKSFLVVFDKMFLQNPGGVPIKHKNCVAALTLHIPKGLQVTLSTVTTRGYAYLPWGARARQTSTYFIAGDPMGALYESQLKGPHDDSYAFTDHIPIVSQVWSGCGEEAIFAVNTGLTLNMTSRPWAPAYFNAETTDGKFQKVFQLQWRSCSH